MSAGARVYTIVAACALGAAAAVVGVTAATHHSPPKPPGPRLARVPFAPDRTASREVAAAVQGALDAWPHGTIRTLRRLAEAHPKAGIVQVNLGLAYYVVRRDAEAVAAWRKAERIDPDSQSAIRAGDLLHPSTPPGLPFFVPAGSVPHELRTALSLQRQGYPVSAERALARLAARRPNDVEAQVAYAVSRYRKDHPERAFSRLGPLAKRFPQAQTVRFHLGLLSIWIGDFREAKRQLGLARDAGPGTRLGREAKTLLASLVRVGTS